VSATDDMYCDMESRLFTEIKDLSDKNEALKKGWAELDSLTYSYDSRKRMESIRDKALSDT